MATKKQQPTTPQIDAATIRAKRQGMGGGNFIPTSIPQAWGLGVQKYLLPLFAQGIQSLIDGYKDRGRTNNEIIQQVRDKGIGSLTPAQLAKFYEIKDRSAYKGEFSGDEFNPPSTTESAPTPATPEATPKLLGDVPQAPTGDNLEANAWHEWNERFPNGTGDESQGSNVLQPFALNGDSLANFGQENADALIQNLGQNPEFWSKEELLKQLFGGGGF